MTRPFRTAVYTGSFDPITLGHLHIIQRASPLFDELVIGIGINADKKALFAPEERVKLVSTVTNELDNVRVEVFHGLAVDFVRSMNARVMVRGIRPLTDIAGEFTMMMANFQLAPDIETVFLMAAERYAHVSSSLLKQIAALNADDEQLAKFVPRKSSSHSAVNWPIRINGSAVVPSADGTRNSILPRERSAERSVTYFGLRVTFSTVNNDNGFGLYRSSR